MALFKLISTKIKKQLQYSYPLILLFEYVLPFQFTFIIKIDTFNIIMTLG